MENDEDKKAKLDEVFTRGVGAVYDPDGRVREKIEQKTRGEYPDDIVIKFGVDPTRPDIHLGHAVVFRKLRFLQDLGCKVVFLVGDFTAQIGDPTGKNKARPDIEQKEVEDNMRTYLDQVGRILRTDKKTFSWMRNSEWFYNVTDIAAPKNINMNVKKDGQDTKIPIKAKSFIGKAVYYESTRMQKTHLKRTNIVGVSLRSFVSTLSHITHGRLVERDMFQERIKNGEELSMHEMIYPVLQGIDSVMIERIYGSCDMEVGGTDQTFNMLIGRDVMKMNKMTRQSVLSFELLEGTDGYEKMSKSLDNYVSITDKPADMYGKIMSVPDDLLVKYFELCTYTPLEEIKKIEKDLAKGESPRDIKMRLAREIVSIYHGEKASTDAEKSFVDTFQKGGIPSDLPEVAVSRKTTLFDVLLGEGLVKSRSEFRRLIEEGAVSDTEDGKITDPKFTIEETLTVRVGKKRFLKINIS